MTKIEAEKILSLAELQGFHYKKGYVCYQKDGLSPYFLLNLGHNQGAYGWNWTLYLHVETKTFYCSCYRNSPYHEF